MESTVNTFVLFGTLFNVATVLIGGLLGLFIRSNLPDRISAIAIQAMGLFTFYLGISMTLGKEGEILVVIFSLVIGSVLGESLKLEQRFEKNIDRFKKKNTTDESDFTEALITTFVLFCVGPMTILGAIEEGLGISSNLLTTKSIMDGFTALALAASLGRGVVFSVIPLFFFQAFITISASWVTPYFSDIVLANISIVGGIMLLGLSINILDIKKISIFNMLPALIVVVLFSLAL